MNPDHPFPLDEHSQHAYNRMRRLQEQNLSDIPGLLTQKAMSSFTLHDEPEPEAAQETVDVIVYPQDPFVGAPEVRQMNLNDINPGLVNSRVWIQDSIVKPAKPDDEGNYLYWPGTPEFDQVNAFYYTTFTLRMFERYARRALPWSFPSPRIAVNPHVGDGANAFYSEQDRLLGFNSFEVDGEFIFAAQSADVVSHEAGHAVLDGIRDLFNESFGLGAMAFHESFGDMSAVLVALHDDSLVKRLVEWTKGDLRLDNFVAAVAEQMTDRLKSRAKHIHGHTVYLRNVLNHFTALSFDDLPETVTDPETQLSREHHNYSRLFSGAFYDILVGIYEQLRASMTDRIAIHRSRDICGYLLITAVELGPVGEMDFSDMAKAFLAADIVQYDGAHISIIKEVFAQRGILPPAEADSFLESLKNLPEMTLPETINSGLASALFLEQIVLPALNLPGDVELIPMSAYRNADRLAYLTYFCHRRITLKGEQFGRFDGSHIDAFGGLTLMFDSDDRLRSVIFRPVTDEDERQIGILTQQMIQSGLVVAGGTADKPRTAAPLHLQPGEPVGLWLPNPPLLDAPPDGAQGLAKLIKFPVIFERIPHNIPDFLSYLRAWQRRG